ncbi:c-type cytochrome [Tateyamaria pelophila]|uniref:c-type cytochrome n=1 Tax=Tateyamaria pelophila TaxID=328415 RepID=UPI001CBEC5D1|nr:cytochrome c [Tateyamaria pelophila]
MSRFFGLSLTALAAVATVSTASADGHTAALENATNARHAQMQVIAYHTGLLGEMAKGTTPYDAATATAAAENLASAASMNRIVLWLEGSEQGAIATSRAKTEIWSDASGFEEMAVALETAADAMVDAAGTDLDSLRAAMGGVGKSCGDCHKAYRGPKN